MIHDERLLKGRRDESRRTIGHMLELLGYPESWAVELEQQAFERGHVWTASKMRDPE